MNAAADELATLKSRDEQHVLALHRWQVPQARGTLAIVHGLTDHGQRYNKLAAAANRADWDAAAIDLRGHGQSQGQRGHADRWTDLQEDVRVLLQHLYLEAPELPIYLLGHSMGGTIVLSLAGWECAPELEECGVKGVIALSPLVLPTRMPAAWRWIGGQMLAPFWPTFTVGTQIDLKHLSHDSAANARFRDDPLRHGRTSLRLAAELFQAGKELLSTEFQLPTLIMHGSDDAVTDATATAQVADAQGPQCTFRLWPGLYHELWQEPAREEVFAEIFDWIDKTNQEDNSSARPAEDNI